jgi:hypothetical protein
MDKAVPREFRALPADLFIVDQENEKRPLMADPTEAEPVIKCSVEAVINVIL